jgi:hypothetical protein
LPSISTYGMLVVQMFSAERIDQTGDFLNGLLLG